MESRSQKDALDKLGLSLAGKNYARLVAACAVYHLPVPPKWGVRPDEALTPGTPPAKWRILDDADAVRAAVGGAPSWSVAAQRLWGSGDVDDRRALQIRSAELGVFPEPRRQRRSGILRDREAVTAAVKDAKSIMEALTTLGLSGSSYSLLKAACDAYGLRIPYADPGDRARIGHETSRAAYRWGRPEDVLRQDPTISQRRVRNMVLRYDVIPYVCAICDSPPPWRGTPLILILDHVNGDHSDHRKENLRFVCPNCESQLPTHGARNTRARVIKSS
jgi:hypothetical protein